jgi:hypothetical protein
MATFWEEVNEDELRRGWEVPNFSLTKNWSYALPLAVKMESFDQFKTSLYSVYSKEEQRTRNHEFRTHPITLNEAERCGIKKIYTPHEAFSIVKEAILSGKINERQSVISVYYQICRHGRSYDLYLLTVVRDSSAKHLWISAEEVTYNAGHSHSTRIAFL